GAFYESTPAMTTHGWDVASVNGTFGAAAAAAKLLKLNPTQVKMVFSMAASGACGFIQQTGSSTHYLEFGIVARHGVEAAELIKAGFTAQEDIFWRPRTYGHAFCGEGGYDFSKLSKNLGNPYKITGVNIKKYSCCFRTHRAIDATLQLMKENKLRYEDIAGVDVDMNQYDADLLRYPVPESGQQSRFSMPHTVASAILGEVTVKCFTDDFVNSPKVKEARGKVNARLRTDWSPERFAARTPVTIKTKDGRSFTKELDFPVQPSKEQFLARHRQCCEMVFKPAQVEEFTSAMQHLEDVEDLESVMKLVRGKID
ncbi:MAG: MmgE/PrpD family protein, partial [Dehalococcoidales bacterium]|nr:MmgE/PrpD family protein [Dehalococcoidales bacterium]